MKKVLSLVLAFAMILGSFGFIFGTQFPDVGDNEYFSEPINVLSGLGVIDGFTDGTFRPENTVTRGQMAALIVKALGLPVTGTTNTKFEDCKSNHWASGYVELAESLGIIKGYPSGLFKPDQKVKYNEALTMIINALGYTGDSLTGGYPGAYINQARALGILDICKTTGNADCPRQDVCCFLYKALTAPIGKVNKDDEFVPTVTGKDANGDIYDTMMARLGAVDYKPAGKNAGDPFVVTGKEPDAQINMMNYLGEYVTAYANSKNQILAVKEVKSKFIEGVYGDLNDDYKLEADDEAVLFTNGDENGTAKLSDYKTAPKDEVKVKVAVDLSGKKVGAVYSIQEWEAATSFQADSKVQDDIIDYKNLKGGYPFAVDDDKEIIEKAFSIVGRDKITDIQEKDIVTVYLHKADDSEIGYKAGDIAKIEVGTEIVTGTITKVNKGETDSDTFTIGGTGYGIAFKSGLKSEDLYKLMKDKEEKTFRLDYAGDIFVADEGVEAPKNYAVVLSCGREVDSKGNASAYIELFLADGSSKEFKVDDTKVVDAIEGSTPYEWDYPAYAGDVVQYTLDDDGVVDFLDWINIGGTDVDVSKTGIIGTYKLAKSAVVFNMLDSTKPEKAASYEVVSLADVYGKTISYVGFEDEKVLYAILVDNLNSTAAEKAIFVKAGGADANGALWTALYEGEVKEFTVKLGTGAADEIVKYTSGQAVTLHTLSMNADGVVTTVSAALDSFDGKLDNTTDAIVVNEDGSITDGSGANFDVADKVAVYLYDGKNWTAKSISALDVRVNTYAQVWYFMNDDSELATIVIIKE